MAFGDAKEGEGGFGVVGGVEAFYPAETEGFIGDDGGFEGFPIGCETEGMSHYNHATCGGNHFDTLLGSIAEAIAVAKGAFTEVLFKGFCEICNEAALDKGLRKVNATDEVLACESFDFCEGEVNAIVLKGLQHGFVTRFSAIEHFFEFGLEGRVFIVEAEPYKVELTKGDLCGEFYSRDAKDAKALGFVEEVCNTTCGIMIGERHDGESCGFAEVGDFAWGE